MCRGPRTVPAVSVQLAGASWPGAVTPWPGGIGMSAAPASCHSGGSTASVPGGMGWPGSTGVPSMGSGA